MCNLEREIGLGINGWVFGVHPFATLIMPLRLVDGKSPAFRARPRLASVITDKPAVRVQDVCANVERRGIGTVTVSPPAARFGVVRLFPRVRARVELVAGATTQRYNCDCRGRDRWPRPLLHGHKS